MTGVELATGDIDKIQNLYGVSDSVYLTCPERGTGCPYTIEPNRPDDFPLAHLLDCPYCPACGCSKVIVPRGEYVGPDPKFRDLDQKGSPLVNVS